MKEALLHCLLTTVTLLWWQTHLTLQDCAGYREGNHFLQMSYGYHQYIVIVIIMEPQPGKTAQLLSSRPRKILNPYSCIITLSGCQLVLTDCKCKEQHTCILSVYVSKHSTPVPATFLVSTIVLSDASKLMCLALSVAST